MDFLSTRPRTLLLGLALVVAATAGLAGGCENAPPEPAPGTVPKPTTPATAKPTTAATPKPAAKPASPSAALRAISWTKPDAWTLVDHPSRMRKATYKIPGADGANDAEMSITQVGGAVAANIQRWEGQFKEGNKAQTTEKTVNGVTVSIVEISGTFSGGMMPGMAGGAAGPQENYTMLAAIAHTTPAHFFKMTGPAKTVAASRPDFDKLVASIAKK